MDFIASNVFGIILANYFDDFPIVEPEDTAEDAVDTFAEMCNIIGWEVKPNRDTNMLPKPQ